MNHSAIYKTILSCATLLPHHREQFKVKRGFTDAIIDQFQFKSAGKYLLDNPEIKALPESFRKGLGFDNILIPFFDPNGEIYHLRPHRFGFEGVGHHMFVPYPLLTEDTSSLVLAESEFKAIASCLLGVPAIGLAGISSFSKKNLPQLIEILKTLECKKVIVCFDNETKDHKPHFTQRYDTIIYEYIMAMELKKNGFESGIARLNDLWRRDGKADIDSCLAQGVLPIHYQYCIQNPIQPYEYRAQWKLPPVHRAFVEREIERHFYPGPVNEQFQCYWLGNGEKKKKLTNFSIKIAYTMFGANGAERYCRLQSAYGTSNAVTISPDVMVSAGAFRKFCYGLGDYEYMGADSDLPTLWHYAFLHQEGKCIKKLEHFGYDAPSQAWFFGNGAYHNNIFYPVDDDNMVWIGDDGYMLPLNVEEDKDSPLLPILSQEDTGVSIVDIFKNASQVIDQQYCKMILGWTLGNFFMPEILKAWETYPFLFFYGKQQSGKSTFANWISSFFGFTQKGVRYGSTLAGIKAITSKLSMVPLWLEEYRNDAIQLAGKNGYLRSIYDRSLHAQATRTAGEIKTFVARSTIILSGEETPRDAALNGRCMTIPIFRSPGERPTMGFEWMKQNQALFSSIGHKILTNKKFYWEKIKERVDAYLATFEGELSQADSRSRLHNSIIAGVCDAFLGESQDFVEFIGQHTMDRTRMVDTSQALNVFYEDISNLYGTGKIDYPFLKSLTKPGQTALWFSGLYSTWEVAYRNLRNDLPASKMALLEHLKTEPYFIKRLNVKMGEKTLSCLILNADHKTFPETLKNILKNQSDLESYYTKESRYDTEPESTEMPKPIFGKKC